MPVDCALQNAGGVRISIEQGPISVGQVYTLLPFSNVVSVLKVTGGEVTEALENGVADVENGGGRFA